MAKQNKDYGYDIQKLYLEMMLANAETFVRCQSIFDFSLFDRKLQETAQFVEIKLDISPKAINKFIDFINLDQNLIRHYTLKM